MQSIPSLQQLKERFYRSLQTELGLTDTELKKVDKAFSNTVAAELKLLYLFLGDIQKNVFPDTSDTFENGGTLDRQGAIWLNRQRTPATNGVYNIQFTGTENSVVRSGVTFKSNDTSLNPGKIFILENSYTLTGNNQVEIRSLEPGLDSLLSVNDVLTITEPIEGVEQTVTVVSISENPLSEETVEDYRERILLTRILEPQGGAKTDYRLWSNDAQGVRKIYPYIKDGDSGTVEIFVEATATDSFDGFGTPPQSILDSVQAVCTFDPDDTIDLNQRGRKPIQAFLEVSPIVAVPVDVRINSLNEDTTEIRATIQKAIENYLFGVRPFVEGADLQRDKNDILYSVKISSIVTDSLTNSNFYESLDMFVNGNIQNSFIFSRADIPYLRNLTFA